MVGGDVVHHQGQHVVLRCAQHGSPDRPVVFQVEAEPALGVELTLEPFVAVPAGPAHRHRFARIDDLVRRAVDLAIGGAQDLVPVDDIVDRGDERVGVAGTGESRGERDVVDRVRSVDAELEPLAQLRGGHLQRTVAVDRHHGRPVTAAAGGPHVVDVGGQLGDGGQLEDLLDADVDAAPRPDRGHQFGGQQRVTTQVEERVVGAHGVAAQQLPEQPGDDVFGVGSGFAVFGARGDLGLRQRFSVDLAV